MSVPTTPYRATHADSLTQRLRARGWQPTEVELCGCNPQTLCAGHREIRAVEHYHPETIGR